MTFQLSLRGKSLLATTALIALLAFVPPAQAYEVTSGGIAATDGSGLTSAVGASTIIDFNSVPVSTSGVFTVSGVLFVGDGQVVNGSSAMQYSAPAGDSTNYLIAGGSATGYAGNEDALNIGGSNNYFGLYWGSIEAYNTLSFYDNGSLVTSISGSQLPVSTGTDNYINFFDLPTYDAVVLTSTQANFAADNLAFGTVPEPGTLALFGLGLVGLGLIRQRQTLKSGSIMRG